MHQRALTEQKHNLELEVERLGRTLRDVLETATQHEVRVAEVTATNEALYKKVLRAKHFHRRRIFVYKRLFLAE